jgi:hypothetical protein
MDELDLWTFWRDYSPAGTAERLQLLGHAGAGSIITCRDLSAYACNKAVAMACRARGDIRTAQMYELICERIYAKLPAEVRW